jgi:acetyl/propionyl-CoA carboxylase alpha subunit/acetyl-CoA carboxylase carboxyltransferase component
VFVGPRPATIALFGDKLRARALAQSLGIPVVAGSAAALTSAADAAKLAGELGFPVMLKAAAGGGGRGMRVVHAAREMSEAFERAQSEALAAFGDGALFVERLVARPRHIEVQILADGQGGLVHLHERDCSVQLRNQKVIEMAPAPNLDPALREKLFRDALALARAADFANAGTVEFLVVPETGEHFFIECNPRIQVEHTVSELVTGVDLVEAQLQIAAGASLMQLGIAGQAAIGAPRGFALQARVVAQGAGMMRAYKEPSGPHVRVDACGYAGYAPPPQFDPLFAKLIAGSGSAGTFAAAVDRALRALAEFHVEGIETNLASLRAILSHAEFRAGDARTTLLAEVPELLRGELPASLTVALLSKHGASTGSASLRAPMARASQLPAVEVEDGHEAVACPIAGAVVEVRARVGDAVAAGDALLVLSAMKMETVITAPCPGRVASVLAASPGDALEAGQIVASIAPAGQGGNKGVRPQRFHHGAPWQEVLDQVDSLRALSHARLAPGSRDPGVVRQRSRGKLTCRERIALVLDAGTFREIGSVAGFASYGDDGKPVEFTPANHVGGYGKIAGRTAVVCADDFTSRGGHADGAIGAKSTHLDRLALELRAPSLRLLDGSSGGGSVAAMVPQQKREGESAVQESTGAIKAGRPRVAGGGGSFLPGHLGSDLYTQQLATVPVVNLLLGSVVGIGAAKAVLGHFSVMVRDLSQLFVAGPPVVRHAVGYEITKEELGGWQIHCTNGAVDNLAETEEEAVAQAKRFLSYLPSSVYEAPPRTNASDPADRREEELLTLVPRKRTTTFDVRRAIRLIADRDSFFELGPLWGTDQITGFVRFGGRPLGVIASDSRHVNGGALTAQGCEKLTRHLDLCDLFHIPVLNLVDNPGFAVGKEHEIAATIRRGGTWMVAFAQVSVPIFTVLMRRSFGVAGNNLATPVSRACVRVAWPAADVGGIPPEGGIEAAYKRQLAESADPVALRAEIEARIESVRGPLGPLSKFQLEELIDPRDTRRLVCEWAEIAHRVATEPARLQPRALGFRP